MPIPPDRQDIMVQGGTEKTSSRAALIYAAMVAGAVGLFVVVKTAGKVPHGPATKRPGAFWQDRAGSGIG